MVTQDRHIDRRILLEADSLEEAGWSVRILALPDDGDAAGQDDPRVLRIADGSGNLQGREGAVLAVYRWVRQRFAMGGRLMGLLKQVAWAGVVRPETFYLRLFEPAVRAHPADVYLAHDLPMLPVGVAAKRMHRARLVYDSHELYAEQAFPAWQRRAWRKLEARHIGECDAVMTVNASIARELRERYGLQEVGVVQNAERAFVQRTGERRFHEAFDLPDQARVLLYQGGLTAGRQIDSLVQAFSRIRDASIHLVLLGSGALGESVRAVVEADSSLRGRVHMHAAVPQQQLLAWTACADAGIIPYRADCLNTYYCTPNKLFEFIAAGVPVLGSDLPEIRAIITGHGIGEVADLSSVDKIAAAIDSFFGDPARLSLWRKATVAARQEVHWDAEGAKVVRIFGSLR